MNLTCIAVDDEPLALGLVCAFIEKTPFLQLAGRYSSAVEALEGLLSGPPVNVIFLDIQMPDLTGLELARVLERSNRGAHMTRIVFTTAFDQFALDGFRVDALDYLLKPFNYEEFLRAASKARHFFDLVQRPEPTPAVQILSAPSEVFDDYLFLKVEYQLVRIAYNDILYIEGLKDYVKVYRQSEPDKPLLSLTSLKALEEKLPASQFMRVHRSFIVSLQRISAFTRNSVQIGSVVIPVSDQYKDVFSQFISRWL
ncbi:LytR/AlgR family response regulator transcription factor [Spirosoma fluviale]|uniref:Two component transcriptional regulator, LytTR family n=1 Tax=Spirosoma fluviale TaxID=1597977 RepID=A0A286F4I8_9BACT|nr:LytTR family DNA-binding domain-containing protein [Spirosoma fluviale]SOD78131.1 two component transcriptional regulator, LytTR family [Spirosoma fluviale]